ncbi:MAG: hypothetical protein ABI601_06070 [bacterium]
MRIALLDPVGDAGIGGYTHELAEALSRAGAIVDVFSVVRPFAERLPRSYTLIPLFGGPTLDQEAIARLHGASALATTPGEPVPPPTANALDDYFDVLERRRWDAMPLERAPPPATPNVGAASAPPSPLPCSSDALTAHLCAVGYDTVWTQWPALGSYDEGLRERCTAQGAHVVHTVHNVLPHERTSDDVARHRRVYLASELLVVHSEQAAVALAAMFPEVAERIVESRHGTYTLYPRLPAARDRVRARLGVADDVVLALVFGGVRPYKNVEEMLEALRDDRCRNVVAAVAGWEWGYDDLVRGDRLGRTRRLVDRLGVADRVRLLPGPFGVAQTAALFEASDVVPLPYLESSGSGVLCLGLTFQRHLLCTRTGGMDEYLADYAAHTVLDSGGVEDIATGLAAAEREITAPGRVAPETPVALHWDALVVGLLSRFAATRLATTSGGC